MSTVSASRTEEAAGARTWGFVAALVGGWRRAPGDGPRPNAGRSGLGPWLDRAADDGAAGGGDSGGSSRLPSGPPAAGRGGSRRAFAPAVARHDSGVPARRREIEAELIGLPDAAPEWWDGCWEQGLAHDLPAEQRFDALVAQRPGLVVLHGLHVAGTQTVIDHLVIGPGGVVVAGTETCTGRTKSDGVHLKVRGRDRSPTIDVALWRAEVVRRTLESRGIRGVPVHGVVHWEHIENLGDRAICLRGVPLLSAGAAVGLAATGIAVSPLMVERIAAVLGRGSA